MKKKRSLFLLILIVFFLAAGFFHHHADGRSHKDCSVCSLGIQNGTYLSPLAMALNPLFTPLPPFFLGSPLPFISELSKVFSVRAPPSFPFPLS
jgi:hypothetical protein